MRTCWRSADLITSFKTDAGLGAGGGWVSFSIPKGKTVGPGGRVGLRQDGDGDVDRAAAAAAGRQGAGRGDPCSRARTCGRCRAKRIHEVRGGEIGVIFQEPMSALNPVHRVGRSRSSRACGCTRGWRPRRRWQEAVELLEMVGIPAPEQRLMDYPHQLSGGMRQRVMIAIAIACRPDLLISDEPTTALDVTVQAQILELIERMQSELGMSQLLITHDLGVIAENCDEVVVMYAGRVVERAPVRELFANPRHAYTKGLLSSIPRLENEPRPSCRRFPARWRRSGTSSPGCRFCQRMERDGPTLHERPPFREIAAGHWVEACEICYGE